MEKNMFCRNCGKELANEAVACTGCGMNPKKGNSNCPGCGEKTGEEQIICTACGASLTQGNADGWSQGGYIGLIILSVFIPLFGWIFGGIQANKASSDSKRKKQAMHYVYAGIGGLVFNWLLWNSIVAIIDEILYY